MKIMPEMTLNEFLESTFSKQFLEESKDHYNDARKEGLKYAITSIEEILVKYREELLRLKEELYSDLHAYYDQENCYCVFATSKEDAEKAWSKYMSYKIVIPELILLEDDSIFTNYEFDGGTISKTCREWITEYGEYVCMGKRSLK
jgi:hypothetical protein